MLSGVFITEVVIQLEYVIIKFIVIINIFFKNVEAPKIE